MELSRSFDFKIGYAYRAEVRVKNHKDNITDNNYFKLVLSDMQTHGYGMVWFQYVWTERWRVSGLPETKTVKARIKNRVTDDQGRR
ncbi:MAG: hypothetical protein OXF68_06040 [Gammaproteobacteria bacterium]|nr:hypothetical protein [Gammaproteobacteria bacterium]